MHKKIKIYNKNIVFGDLRYSLMFLWCSISTSRNESQRVHLMKLQKNGSAFV